MLRRRRAPWRSVSSVLHSHTSGQAGPKIAARSGSQVLGFDTGHWVMVEKPAEFNQAVTAWMSAGDAVAQSR